MLRFLEALPVKVSQICQAFDIRILRAPLPARISGEIRPSATEPGKFEIKINRYESEVRQRFTAAHELAHYLLHRDVIGDGIVDSVLYRSRLSDVREAEANRLAADILMPINQITSYIEERRAYDFDDEQLSEMAEMFKVSEMALRFRLGR
tara:strand:- start:89 stop:541 length:453 start_codon:yes stop_codon:yes gene_type:complete